MRSPLPTPNEYEINSPIINLRRISSKDLTIDLPTQPFPAPENAIPNVTNSVLQPWSPTIESTLQNIAIACKNKSDYHKNKSGSYSRKRIMMMLPSIVIPLAVTPIIENYHGVPVAIHVSVGFLIAGALSAAVENICGFTSLEHQHSNVSNELSKLHNEITFSLMFDPEARQNTAIQLAKIREKMDQIINISP